LASSTGSPRGKRPNSRFKHSVTPLSSTKTRFLTGTLFNFAVNKARLSSDFSLQAKVFFYCYFQFQKHIKNRLRRAAKQLRRFGKIRVRFFFYRLFQFFPVCFSFPLPHKLFFKVSVLKFFFPFAAGYGRYLKGLSKFLEGMPRVFIFRRPLLIANAVRRVLSIGIFLEFIKLIHYNTHIDPKIARKTMRATMSVSKTANRKQQVNAGSYLYNQRFCLRKTCRRRKNQKITAIYCGTD
jgi:hypothetical protein